MIISNPNINKSRINICRENSQSLEDIQNQSSSSQNQTPIIDLTKAPELNYKYGRTSEIATLKQWILENIINWLARQNEAIDISQKPTDLELSNARFIKVLQSLNRRCLVEKVLIEEKVKFKVNSLFRIYLNN
ncbi:MAG: hypothetical protein ACKO9I_01145 [Sphaerospermopsis kisseleviana]|uniref:Uncharacterized protein n=1 Tax=Sphaerospermopsis kisseleviana CS-549 TaxID=3021783 RepID=A0ABT4ZMV0_9CYAN|nr:hypothetical protein [Sphaerospermopsis kisseleviana]MDB9440138.1 hypothetical protein [Sphaerospermopsis kisseleviana CS-549]BAZ83228.1 hypothetical protein NIES73_45150 [Sphaerospermopsis kisseleviana NIES-73]